MESLKKKKMDQLITLEPRDLEILMHTEPCQLLGRIIRLNQARYHNGLNAIVLMGRLLEMRHADGTKQGEK